MGAVLGLLVLVLAVPVWFPWVLRPVARRLGATYGRYQREGYARFSVRDLNYRHGSTLISIGRLDAPVPTVWLWRLAVGRTNAPFVAVDGWRYETGGSTGEAPVAKKVSNYPAQLQKLGEWLPAAGLSNGTVQLHSIAVEVPTAVWSQGSLTGLLSCTAKLPFPPGPGASGIQATLAAVPAGANAYQVQLRAPALHLLAEARIATATGGVLVQSTNSWWGNAIELTALLAPGQSLPETARLSAPKILLPPEATGIPHYGNLAGSIAATWQDGRFGLDLKAQAQPLPVATNFPPLSLTLHAAGDTNLAVIEKATLVSPWLRAELSRGLEVHFSGKMLRQRAFLDVMADLDRQPWFPARGRLTGEAEFTPSWGQFPSVDFRLSGSEVGYRSIQTRASSLQGDLNWPNVVLSRVQTTLADGSTVQADGTVNLAERTVSNGHFQMAGPWFKRWLPPGYDFGAMDASGSVAGPFAALEHQGRLSVANLTSPYFRPLGIKADWQGVGSRLTNADLTARAGHSSLQWEGAFEGAATNARVQLRELSLWTNREQVLQLVRPGEVEFLRFAGSKEWSVRTSPLAWEGKAAAVGAQASVSWPRQGSFNLNLHGLSTSLADDFIKTNLPAISLNTLEASGGWSNGPAQVKLTLDARAAVGNEKLLPAPLRLRLQAVANADGVVVSNLVATSRGSPALSAQGLLPVFLNPSATSNVVQIQPDRALRFHAAAVPGSLIWGAVAKASGLGLVDANFTMDVSGTWATPLGRLRLQADQVELLRLTNAVVPAVKDLELALEVDPQQARLTVGEALVQGERVSFSGDLPLGREFWTRLRHKQLPDWTRARASLQVEDANLAAFEPLVPKVLVPQGQASIHLALLPGGDLEGRADIKGARTQPLGQMGPIRGIGVNLRLRHHVLTIESASVNIGSASVTLSGQADLAGTTWLKGETPPFKLTLRGASVPLVRTPELVLRGDLLLAVTKTNGAPPLISGQVTLGDSFYLSDFQALIPGKVNAPQRRPPYFSISEPFVSGWRLAIDVQGQKFLNVRSPLFNGKISASLQLQGTLQEPVALGDVRIESGMVRFPFANLSVQQGVITLGSQDPYHPQISVAAASKQFGYDIRMEVSGPVDAPIIQFSSTPPLTSEQILLMVTAGEMPQGTFSLSAQQRAQTVALFLGRDLLTKLGIGQGADQRLSVRTGEEISEQGRPTYNVEYKLTDRWSLTGEYDRFGDFNAGLKWRIFSK